MLSLAVMRKQGASIKMTTSVSKQKSYCLGLAMGSLCIDAPAIRRALPLYLVFLRLKLCFVSLAVQHTSDTILYNKQQKDTELQTY